LKSVFPNSEVQFIIETIEHFVEILFPRPASHTTDGANPSSEEPTGKNCIKIGKGRKNN
jgi:hypothetical protein